MAFGRRTNAAPVVANSDYGAPAIRSNKLHRPLIIANHALHIISSLVVLGISAYFIDKYAHNTHLVYWTALVCHPSSFTSFISLSFLSIFYSLITWLRHVI